MTVAGIIATAVLAAALVMPAVRQFGSSDAWLGVVIMLVPTVALLTVTGFAHYGWWRSLAVAAAVMVVTSVVTFVIAVFTVASALSESGTNKASATSMILGIAVFAAPFVLVLVLGLLALRLVPGRQTDAGVEPERVSTGEP